MNRLTPLLCVGGEGSSDHRLLGDARFTALLPRGYTGDVHILEWLFHLIPCSGTQACSTNCGVISGLEGTPTDG